MVVPVSHSGFVLAMTLFKLDKAFRGFRLIRCKHLLNRDISLFIKYTLFCNPIKFRSFHGH